MSGTPRFKVIAPNGTYVASCKHVEDAAMLIGGYGDGAKIKDGSTSGPIVWHEGREKFCAADSYDWVTLVVWKRIDKRNRKALDRLRAQGHDV